MWLAEVCAKAKRHIKVFGSYLRDVTIHIQSLGNCPEVLFVSSESLIFYPSCGSRSEVKRENLRKFGFLDFSHCDPSHNCTS